MSNVVKLAFGKFTPADFSPLVHPAGVDLSFHQPSDAAPISPEIGSAIRQGTYNAGLIRSLPDAVREGDRVLVIGAGLGVVSTLVAKTAGVTRVVAVEPDIKLIGHLNRAHAQNGVPWVETMNAVLGGHTKGRVPFFARRDLRASSTIPEDGPWDEAMMVPWMDLELIVTDEQINVIICEAPIDHARLLRCLEVGLVERILFGGSDTGPDQQVEELNTHRQANLNRPPVRLIASNSNFGFSG